MYIEIYFSTKTYVEGIQKNCYMRLLFWVTKIMFKQINKKLIKKAKK